MHPTAGVFTVTFVPCEKSGVDRADALRHWGKTHGSLVGKAPGVRRYVRRRAVAAAEADRPFLGVAGSHFADRNAVGGVADAPEFAPALAEVDRLAAARPLTGATWMRWSSPADRLAGARHGWQSGRSR
jgi:uncharacterized protein (TIGR02118 family)